MGIGGVGPLGIPMMTESVTKNLQLEQIWHGIFRSPLCYFGLGREDAQADRTRVTPLGLEDDVVEVVGVYTFKVQHTLPETNSS